MSYHFKLAGIIAIFSIIFLSMAMTPIPKKVIFFGDSITQQGVGKKGYISLLKKI